MFIVEGQSFQISSIQFNSFIHSYIHVFGKMIISLFVTNLRLACHIENEL